jgi:hypothetical protein
MSRLRAVTVFFARSGRAMASLSASGSSESGSWSKKGAGKGRLPICLDIPGWPFLVQLTRLSKRCRVYLRGRYLHVLKD